MTAFKSTHSEDSLQRTGKEPIKAEVIDGFDGIARRYDLLTRMNPGYMKHLRWSARRLALGPNARILDLCCGTGSSTTGLIKTYPDAKEIVGLDASAGMLGEARKAHRQTHVSFVHGNAMDPVSSGIEGPFDGILMAYGIRNMPDADTCLANLLPLLRPGGKIVFHEYSVADSKIATGLWNAVSLGIILPSGLAFTGRTDIWTYLRKSVLEFDGVRAFESRLRRAGFVDVETLGMDGWQKEVVHSFIARRPMTEANA